MTEPELRTALSGLEIFEGLTEEQLDWLVSVSEPRVLGDGEVLFRDGEEATGFHVLLAGGLVVTKVVDGREEVLTRHSTEEESAAAEEHDGKPSAAHRFTGELPLLTDGSYVATAAASGPTTTVVAYPKPVFFEMLTRCHGVAAVLIPVLAWRIKSSEVQARKRATVEALGTLAAGLAHELNNPAAAVARAAQELAPALERLTRTAYAWGAAASGAGAPYWTGWRRSSTSCRRRRSPTRWPRPTPRRRSPTGRRRRAPSAPGCSVRGSRTSGWSWAGCWSGWKASVSRPCPPPWTTWRRCWRPGRWPPSSGRRVRGSPNWWRLPAITPISTAPPSRPSR